MRTVTPSYPFGEFLRSIVLPLAIGAPFACAPRYPEAPTSSLDVALTAELPLSCNSILRAQLPASSAIEDMA